MPLARWLRHDLSGVVRDCLLSDASRCRRYLNRGYVEKVVAMHARGRSLDLQLWTLISFELWCRRFLDGERVRRVPDGRLDANCLAVSQS